VGQMGTRRRDVGGASSYVKLTVKVQREKRMKNEKQAMKNAE
jgi:hypothetical protein